LQHASRNIWTFEHKQCEFVIAGDDNGPQFLRLDLALFVAAHIEEFVAEANEYLASFVAPERFEASGPWHVQSIEFGRKPTAALDVFEMQLVVDGDTYGLWRVRFRYHSPPIDRYFPEQFSRQQQ
jgi:hypothetical protein